MKSMTLRIDTQDIGKDVLIKVSGEVDLYSSPELRSTINKSFMRAANTVAVDLREVSYMDSSGVATLIEGLRMGKSANKSFFLITPSNPVMKVLRLARLDSIFDIRESWDSSGEESDR